MMGFVSVSIIGGSDGMDGLGGDLERSRVDVDMSDVVVAAAAPPPPQPTAPGGGGGARRPLPPSKMASDGLHSFLLVYFSLRFADNCRLQDLLLPFSRSLFLALHPGCYKVMVVIVMLL